MKIGLILSASALAVAAVAVAAMPLQDAKAKTKPDDKAAAHGAPDKAAMQAAMEKAGALGPQHAELKKMVGTWKVNMKCWDDPSQPAQESTGTSTMEMILGDRQLVEHFSGTMMGQPFDGMGIMGFNNSTGEYEHVWSDNFNTGKMWSHGKKAADGTTTMTGESHCAMGPMTCRSVMKPVSDDAFHFEMYGTMADAPEFKMMEMDYTRSTAR